MTERAGAGHLVPQSSNRILLSCGRRTELQAPAAAARQRRKHELDGLRRRIEHDIERRLSRLRRAERIGEKTSFREIPILLRHLGRPRRHPQHPIAAIGLAAVDETARPQLSKPPPQRGQLADQLAHVLAVAAELRPVHPANRIVLAIGVVVAALAVADLVAGEQQRHALCEQQAGQQVAPQLPPQLQGFRIVGRPLGPAIGAVIVVGAVVIVLAVGFVVLVGVAHQVGEREPVMYRDVIDAGARERPSWLKRSVEAVMRPPTSPITLPSLVQ